MKRLATVDPCKEIRQIVKSAPFIEFTHGVDWTHTKSGQIVSEILGSHKYTPIYDGLALRGSGSVLPHIDSGLNLTCVWLVFASEQCHLMYAKSGLKEGDTRLTPGSIIVFDSRLLHAWVSRGRWGIIVQSLRRKK